MNVLIDLVLLVVTIALVVGCVRQERKDRSMRRTTGLDAVESKLVAAAATMLTAPAPKPGERYTLHLDFPAADDTLALAIAASVRHALTLSKPGFRITGHWVTDSADWAEHVTRCADVSIQCEGPLRSYGIGKRLCAGHAAWRGYLTMNEALALTEAAR